MKMPHAAVLGILLVCATAAAGETPAPQTEHNKSWIRIDPKAAARAMVEGEDWEVPIEYSLDASESAGKTVLSLIVPGPWIDTPDGVYTKQRGHVWYPGLGGEVPIQPGHGTHVFKFKIPPALPRNSLLLIAKFKEGGKAWPWEVRRGGPWFQRKGGFFELETAQPGNLFLYREPVRVVAKLKNVGEAGAEKKLAYRVLDAEGAEVAKGEVAFAVKENGQDVAIDLDLKARGIFLIEAEVAGWEKRVTTIARIPDVLAETKGGRTPFATHFLFAAEDPVWLERRCAIAQRLGLTGSRTFVGWHDLEPARGRYEFEPYDKAMDLMKKYGIDCVVCIGTPPSWAQQGGARNSGFGPVYVDLAAFKDFVKAAGERWKGKLYAWEWLNEITPGNREAPVETYLAFCKAGYEAAKAADPQVKSLLAGGLWPRTYRNELLQAGIAKYLDVLPVHYSNAGGVQEAREDLDRVGAAHVAVWDDESARGANTWNVPPLETIADRTQAQWVLTQWPDELMAGCERIFYFGGSGTPTGGWDYLMDDLTPRPVTVTLAVLASKLARAKPVGAFMLGKAARFLLFERDGRAVLVACSYEEGERVDLTVGASELLRTDYQGNESAVAVKGGAASLALGKLPCFLEGGDLDILKTYVVGSVGAQQGPARGSSNVVNFRYDRPRLTALQGQAANIGVTLRNPYARKLSGKVQLKLPEGWPAVAPAAFGLAPGESKFLSMAVAVPKTATARDEPVEARFAFDEAKLPASAKAFTLAVLAPDMIGNLIKNGGFEDGEQGPDAWKLDPKTQTWASSEGLGDGLGKRVLKFHESPGYTSVAQNVDLRAGQTYVYSAWVWNKEMNSGSNIFQTMADGKQKPLYDVNVFTCGNENGNWQLYTYRYAAPADLKAIGFSPLAKGAGWACWDNVRVTLFDGSDYAAEAHKIAKAPAIDGKLDDWTAACPIPLIGKNQLTAEAKDYAWSPANLRGVAWLRWDDANLYLAVRVRDDVHHAQRTGDEAIQDDSVILAIDPTNRSPEAATRAYAYYIGAGSPGGGSGKFTLYRPAARSGGLSSGQLAKDSSVYSIAVAREEGVTTYEVRLPFSELGMQPAFGGKFACTIQLTDNDGKGRAATMTWGAGITPAWEPAHFGSITFVE